MTPRNLTLLGVFVGLGLIYIVFFTEWIRPAPILIASQIRFSVQPTRFGRPEKKPAFTTKTAGGTGEVRVVQIVRTNQPVAQEQVERIGRPEKGEIDQMPGGAANVTFSLDDWYQLTRIRVEDVPADGSPPKVQWELVGKSLPLNSLLYGRAPTGMKSVPEGATHELLVPGAPYRLIVEAGRRRGTNDFTTVPLVRPE